MSLIIQRIISNMLKVSNENFDLEPMVFLTGPRQIGKTFYSKSLKIPYYNWDTAEVKNSHLKDPYFFRQSKGWLVFDEIHKRSDWKKILKGYYDSPTREENILLTGSGRFNLFQKGGDSLQGRYELFHMMPITFDEYDGRSIPASPRDFTSWTPDQNVNSDGPLISFGGFPDPLIAQNMQKLNRWLDLYLQRLVKEDIRDFSKVELIDKIELLARILPERICSPISMKSLSEDIETSRESIKNWLRLFDVLYLGIQLPPYSRKIHRAVKKEKKFYFYQWPFCNDFAALFENYMAIQLYTACQYYRDQGYGTYELYYLRDQDDREVDFLITNNLKPVALIEVKSSPQTWTKGLHFYTEKLNVPSFLVYPQGPTVRIEKKGYSLSSARFLKNLTAL